MRKIYPIYITKGIDHVTSKLVADTKNEFVADVVTSLNPDIMRLLIDKFYYSEAAFISYIKQSFMMKINKMQLGSSNQLVADTRSATQTIS